MNIQDEMMVKIRLAEKYQLIPSNLCELEFSYCVKTGQASMLEYWPNSDRLANERVEVHIPAELLDKFLFKSLANCFQQPLIPS
jgi:hypothetical protein